MSSMAPPPLVTLDTTSMILCLLVGISFLFNRLKDFSCSAQRIFNAHLYVRHIFNMVAIFFMVVLFTRNNPVPPYIVIEFSLGMYVFFIMLTRCDFRFICAYFFIVLVIFYIEAQKSWLKVQNPDSVDERIKRKTLAQMILKCIALTVVLIGCIVYIGQKSRHHTGTHWSWGRFFLGAEMCADVPQRVQKTVGADFVAGLERIFALHRKN
jgi:hypothetical protein